LFGIRFVADVISQDEAIGPLPNPIRLVSPQQGTVDTNTSHREMQGGDEVRDWVMLLQVKDGQ
jgi:hypothetical protein